MRKNVYSTYDADVAHANARSDLGTRPKCVCGSKLLFVFHIDRLTRRASRYNFKGKKRKIDEEEEHQLAESVRTISALFQGGNGAVNGRGDEPLEVRVASISAEIAAAIAHAQSRVYEEEEEEDEIDELDEDSGAETGGPGKLGPNTSGIRGGDGKGESGTGGDEDEDSDTFPMPLRGRNVRSRETTAVAGAKRKR